MNVGLLECDHVDERFRHLAGGYREMFEALLRPHLPDLQFSYFDVCHGELPPAIDACDAYICTGSRASVYDQLEWIEQLKTFVRRLGEARQPYVGICFGHQVLAEALGGKVARSGKGWGIGVHDMTVVKREAWMAPPLELCRIQYMHADQVVELPPQAVLLGNGEHCEVAMFRVGETLLGIEGHPEFPAAYSEALIRDRSERIGAEPSRVALASVHRPTDQAVLAQWMVAFLEQRADSL
ncbi:MAG: amidotransferase [Betaproteobacteria bacterium RIFCSPLOWO2_12_FULL_66_14]|nr:MAG: amidotransferase [Betaproteobacteria bacterium RIFCSPLOWO2_12_FULL_66_14]